MLIPNLSKDTRWELRFKQKFFCLLSSDNSIDWFQRIKLLSISCTFSGLNYPRVHTWKNYHLYFYFIIFKNWMKVNIFTNEPTDQSIKFIKLSIKNNFCFFLMSVTVNMTTKLEHACHYTCKQRKNWLTRCLGGGHLCSPVGDHRTKSVIKNGCNFSEKLVGEISEGNVWFQG